MKIQNRFAELLAEKRRRDHPRQWTYQEVQEATGISSSSLVSYSKQRNEMFRSDTLIAFMEFFNCGLCDLLVVVDDEGNVLPSTREEQVEGVAAV